MDKISAIIPVYNCEKFIGRCLASILNQSYRQLEVIVVDDGSKDGSYQIVDKIAESDDRVILLSQKNMGVSAARNTGLAHATGDYITFVDADDWIDKNCYEMMLTKLKHYDSDCIVCGCVLENAEGSLIKVRGMPEDGACKQNEGIMCLFEPEKFNGVLWNKLFRREVVPKDLRFREDIHVWEDVLWCYHAFEYCNTIAYIKERPYHYIQHGTNVTGKGFSEKKISMISAAQQLLEDASGKSDMVFKKVISYIFMNFRGLAYEIKKAGPKYAAEYRYVIKMLDRFYLDKQLSRKEKIHYMCLKIDPKVDVIYSKIVTRLRSFLYNSNIRNSEKDG